MKYDVNILQIANDPATWIHPSWLAHHTVLDSYPLRFQNRLLFERAALAPLSRQELGRWPPLFWRRWNDLATALYLSGARLARGALLLNDAMGKLEHRAERILSYPLPGLPHHTVSTSLPPKADALLTRNLVLNEGWRCLTGGHPALPASLSTRLRLRLPADCPLSEALPSASSPVPDACASSYRQLLQHALGFCHAENY
jgi:hypothetical protein